MIAETNKREERGEEEMEGERRGGRDGGRSGRCRFQAATYTNMAGEERWLKRYVSGYEFMDPCLRRGKNIVARFISRQKP